MIQSFIMLLQRICSLQGLASQEVKWDKASETACCFPGTLQAPTAQKGLPAPSCSQPESKKGKIHILEFTPPSQERAETCTPEPPAGESVNSTLQC